MRIVVLDAVPLDQNDLSWDGFKDLGEMVLHDRTSPEKVIDRCQGADVVLSNKVILDGDVIRACPNLRFIQVMATGVNMVDLEACREASVTVCNVPDYSTGSVVQHTWALILEAVRGVGPHSADVHAGGWVNSNDFSFFRGPLPDLLDRTLGIVGFGSIGSGVAQVAEAFGMTVLVAERPGVTPREGRVALEDLLTRADIVSLHCPLTPETEHLINAERLGLMPSGSWLVNTARGGLIDEAALTRALHEGRLGGAALDVLTTEPPSADHPLLSTPNTILTPHVAWGSIRARRTLMAVMESNLRKWVAGTPENVV